MRIKSNVNMLQSMRTLVIICVVKWSNGEVIRSSIWKPITVNATGSHVRVLYAVNKLSFTDCAGRCYHDNDCTGFIFKEESCEGLSIHDNSSSAFDRGTQLRYCM